MSFEVRAGQRWFIVGPNGQGKTTLLRGLLGLIPAPAPGLQRSDAMHPRHIGFVPQRCDLNPALPTTVREFITLGLVGQSLPRDQRGSRLTEALGQVHLDGLADADYFSLSGGQRQRALLARALIRKPSVLLLDEPTTGLDLTAQRALMEVLMERNGLDGLTILFVTHDVDLARRHATHAALVHGGQVHAGEAGEVLRDEWLKQAYGKPSS